MKKRIPIHLNKNDLLILKQYCKGCRYFDPTKEVVDICTIIGWYNIVNIIEIKEYAKHCPCNQKCLVKAACREVTCPDWLAYVGEAVEKRNSHLLEKK